MKRRPGRPALSQLFVEGGELTLSALFCTGQGLDLLRREANRHIFEQPKGGTLAREGWNALLLYTVARVCMREVGLSDEGLLAMMRDYAGERQRQLEGDVDEDQAQSLSQFTEMLRSVARPGVC